VPTKNVIWEELSMFTQILDPTGNLFVTWLVALIPVVLLLFLLAGLRMSAWLAVLIGSIVTFLLGLWVWKMPLSDGALAYLYGAATGVWNVNWITFWRVMLFINTMVARVPSTSCGGAGATRDPRRAGADHLLPAAGAHGEKGSSEQGANPAICYSPLAAHPPHSETTMVWSRWRAACWLVSTVVAGVVLAGAVFTGAVFTAAAPPAAASEKAFPYGSELMLDASPMRGSKRIPMIEIEEDGAASIDLWCASLQAQATVGDGTISIVPSPAAPARCTPERQSGDDDLIAALAQVTGWSRRGDIVEFSGATTLRFRLMTN
jgi:hypothetical protein